MSRRSRCSRCGRVPAPSFRAHRAAAEIHAEDVDLEHVPPLLPVLLRNGLPAAAMPALAHEEVDRAELALRPLDPLLDVLARETSPRARARRSPRRLPLPVRRPSPSRRRAFPPPSSSRAIEAPIPRPPPVTRATPSSRSDGTRDLLQRLGVLERREVARDPRPSARRAHGAPHDLRAARLRKRGDEERPAPA